MCDLAYVMLLEQLERQTLADRHVAAVLMVAGAQDVTLPSVVEKRQQFDDALVAEPVESSAPSVADDEHAELLQALGVG